MWQQIFKFEPETAHRIAMKALKIADSAHPSLISKLFNHPERFDCPSDVLGIQFRNRLGLAAGFDKNAEYLAPLFHAGFGFIEVGTVTPKGQPGNERPRLYRDLKEKKIFNRMGFNNDGATVIASRIESYRSNASSHLEKPIIGVNIGKNKVTPNDEAQRDYEECARIFKDLADYIVINVSSPNTPGLRELQSLEFLSKLVDRVQNQLARATKTVPLLVKLAPELEKSDYETLFLPLERLGVQGWVLTNTYAGLDPWKKERTGGWSGSVLQNIGRDRLKVARSITSKPIVSVGGILSTEEALERLNLGADLIQIYSGWIFQGPSFISDILEKLVKKA